jgi:glycosyltransferase involved in cell wall biosynthesis
MKRCLLITPYFPPMGVSGAKRPLHLVRNLPEFGWTPVVLAGRPDEEKLDTSLVEMVPSDTVVSYGYSSRIRPWISSLSRKKKREKKDAAQSPKKKSATFFGQDLSFLTPFDRYLIDTPAAIRAGMKLIDEHDIDAIHVMADPWSGLIAAHSLHRKTGLPLIVDLRDPWSQHESKMDLRPRVSQAWLRRFEKKVLKSASMVVLNTEACCSKYIEAYSGQIPPDRFTAIRNAFDPGLFLDAAPPEDGPFSVLYFGRFRKFVGPEQLLKGFAKFVKDAAIEPGDARFLFVGGLRNRDMEYVRDLGLEDYVESRPAVPFRQSLSVLGGADVLTLVIQPDCRLQIPGKLYDYFAAGRKVLAVSANAEANEMIDQVGGGLHAEYGNPNDMAQKLGSLYKERCEHGPVTIDAKDREQFSAREQARRFAEILSEVTSR